MDSLRSIWHYLTTPNNAVTEPVDKRISQTVSGVHLLLLVAATLCVPLVIAANSVEMLSGIVKAILLFGTSYALSRTKYFRWGALLTIFYINGQVLAQLYLLPATNIGDLLPYLLIPIILITIFASKRTVTFAVLINLAVLTHYTSTRSVESASVLGAVVPVALVTFAILWVDNRRRVLEEIRYKAVLEAESNVRSILDTAFHATIVLQNDAITDIGGGFLDLFDVSRAHALGKPLTYFIKDSANRLPLDLSSIRRGNTVEVSGQRHDGTWFDAELVVQDRTHHGEAATILAVRNITERKQTALALQQAQRLDSLGVLAGGIAHDFNNLLTGILTQLSLAQLKLNKDIAAAQHMRKSVASARRASDLTRQLLAYAGKGKIATKTFDIQPLIQECASLVSANNENKATFEYLRFAEQLPIEADLGQIQQVILNLLINASEAIGKKDGEVYISARPFDATLGSRRPINGWVGPALQSKKYIELCVRDTGSGMDAKTKSRIFEPFYTTKDTGTGLGLAATLGVIRTHEGAIQAVSSLGDGTTFYVYLPLAQAAADHSVKVTPIDTHHNGGLTVLAIDDQPQILEGIASILALHDHRVLQATTGERGLSLLWENRDQIDLVILDMQMPRMDGEATFKEIRNICDVPVLLSSGYSKSDGITRLMEQPAVAFLQKPYDAEKLAAMVNQTIQFTPQTVA